MRYNSESLEIIVVISGNFLFFKVSDIKISLGPILYVLNREYIQPKLKGKQLKQIIQTEHNIVNNPNWPTANQLAIYKGSRGFELGATEKRKSR